ncbi:MAG: hypothetical protein JJD92_08420 [Frankiaceae bacterium]|nr:hypothetical protein [Frankiaceae bacterium]
MLRKRVALPLTLAAGLLGSLALVAPAEASHSWGDYHWARAGAFTLQTGDNVTDVWQAQFDAALTDWSTPPGGATPVLTLDAAAGLGGKRCSASTGTIQVCNGKYGRNGWLGLASIYITGGVHITKGTAKMNDTYFSTATYNTPDEKQHVMCQEVGHTFGLGHTSEDGTSQNTCMDYSQSPTSTQPNAHDFQQLASIYNHGDTSTTVAASSGSSGQSVGNERSTWGQEIERGAHGEFSVFMRDFGNGEKVLTHVTWANESDSFGPSHRPE